MLRALAFLLALSFALPSAEAQFGPQPPNQLYYRTTTVARLNPLGLINFSQFTYRRRLFQSNSIFTRDNYIGFGVVPTLSPAFGRIGAQLEFQPVPFLRFWATYEFVGYFGTFDYMQSFANANADYSDSDLDDLDPYSMTGSQLTLSGTLQAKLGPLALRSVLRATRPDYDLRGDDPVYYDILWDSMIENENWFFNNDFDLLYLHQDRFTVGIRYTWTRAFFSGDAFPGTDCTMADCRSDIRTHRIGPLFAYTHFKEYKARYNGPTFLVAINWWLKHPYRTGQDVSQAFPYIILGFSFSGDLLAPPRREQEEQDDFPPPPPLEEDEPEPFVEPEPEPEPITEPGTETDGTETEGTETGAETGAEGAEATEGEGAATETGEGAATEGAETEAGTEAETEAAEPETDAAQ